MSIGHDRPSLEPSTGEPTAPPAAAPSASAPESHTSPYQPCDTCGSPLDERQRYCVACGTRRKHANDPAARFLSAATRRRRSSASGAPVARRRSGSTSLATAAGIALIPLALGAGVLIGRSSAGGDSKLIAALHAEKAPVIQYTGGGGAGAASTGATSSSAAPAATTPANPPTSTFKLSRGYVVQLGTLPSSSSQSAATRAEKADQSKGATGLGVVAQSGFTLTPSPPSGDYVIYSGSYSSKSEAARALAKLKGKFPSAKVVEVQAIGSSSKGAGKPLTKTRYGTAHQVTGYKPSSQALAQGSQAAQHDSHSTGTTASGAGLPDQVAVP